MGTLFVNKSGRAFKITRTNGGSDVIGTLPVNAIFAWTDSWAGNGAGADYQGIYCNGMYGWIGWSYWYRSIYTSNRMLDCTMLT